MSIAAHELDFAFGTTPVLDALSFTLEPGRVVALVGPNGAGKSTVVRLLSRVLEPTGGRIELDGRPLASYRRRELARRLAVVPQGGELPAGFSAEALVRMGRAPHVGFLRDEGPGDLAVVEAVMRRTDTWRLRGREVTELSGGERQRVVLARALAQQPAYLLLDEPTNHLDLRYQGEILRYVRHVAAEGVGALIVLHDLNLAARAADAMLLLAGGRVVARGAPAEVLRAPLLRRVYGPDLQVGRAPDGAPLVLPRVDAPVDTPVDAGQAAGAGS